MDVLDKYDHQTLKKPSKKSKEKYKISYKESIEGIRTLKEKFGGSFILGNEKDESFKSSLENIYLTLKSSTGARFELLYQQYKLHSR
ncbi:MAG: hypothetical protein IPI04_13885 [Ignavibacteria bacterium]|nr:hypothetical protein [Ignavibacteria bacterium]